MPEKQPTFADRVRSMRAAANNLQGMSALLADIAKDVQAEAKCMFAAEKRFEDRRASRKPKASRYARLPLPTSSVHQSMNDTKIELKDPQEAEALKTARIRELNDALRTCRAPIGGLIMNGQRVITQGVAARGNRFLDRAVKYVCAFTEFTPEN